LPIIALDVKIAQKMLKVAQIFEKSAKMGPNTGFFWRFLDVSVILMYQNKD
jgi:hypothetical protein